MFNESLLSPHSRMDTSLLQAPTVAPMGAGASVGLAVAGVALAAEVASRTSGATVVLAVVACGLAAYLYRGELRKGVETSSEKELVLMMSRKVTMVMVGVAMLGKLVGVEGAGAAVTVPLSLLVAPFLAPYLSRLLEKALDIWTLTSYLNELGSQDTSSEVRSSFSVKPTEAGVVVGLTVAGFALTAEVVSRVKLQWALVVMVGGLSVYGHLNINSMRHKLKKIRATAGGKTLFRLVSVTVVLATVGSALLGILVSVEGAVLVVVMATSHMVTPGLSSIMEYSWDICSLSSFLNENLIRDQTSKVYAIFSEERTEVGMVIGMAVAALSLSAEVASAPLVAGLVGLVCVCAPKRLLIIFDKTWTRIVNDPTSFILVTVTAVLVMLIAALLGALVSVAGAAVVIVMLAPDLPSGWDYTWVVSTVRSFWHEVMGQGPSPTWQAEPGEAGIMVGLAVAGVALAAEVVNRAGFLAPSLTVVVCLLTTYSHLHIMRKKIKQKVATASEKELFGLVCVAVALALLGTSFSAAWVGVKGAGVVFVVAMTQILGPGVTNIVGYVWICFAFAFYLAGMGSWDMSSVSAVWAAGVTVAQFQVILKRGMNVFGTKALVAVVMVTTYAVVFAVPATIGPHSFVWTDETSGNRERVSVAGVLAVLSLIAVNATLSKGAENVVKQIPIEAATLMAVVCTGLAMMFPLTVGQAFISLTMSLTVNSNEDENFGPVILIYLAGVGSFAMIPTYSTGKVVFEVAFTALALKGAGIFTTVVGLSLIRSAGPEVSMVLAKPEVGAGIREIVSVTAHAVFVRLASDGHTSELVLLEVLSVIQAVLVVFITVSQAAKTLMIHTKPRRRHTQQAAPHKKTHEHTRQVPCVHSLKSLAASKLF